SQQQQHRQRDEQQVQRVDLGDDRLAPERVRRGEQQGGGDAGENRRGQLRADEDKQRAGERRLDRRREVQRARRFDAGDGQEQIPDREVEGIGGARRDERRSDGRLQMAGVAEVEAG